jgi:hypothetical protein
VPATDNGFMRLNHVRVPLSAMLSKFASVTKEGTYKAPVHSKLSYGGVSAHLLVSLMRYFLNSKLVITPDGLYKGFVSCTLFLVFPLK